MAWACRRCQRVFSDLPERERCPHDDGELVQVTERSLHDEHTGRICDEKYKIGRLLGAGGMGCVHEAVNLRLDQPVAVKFFSPRYVCQSGRDAAQAAERFRREATVMAKARHPNVVHVLDFSIESDGTMYIVMELLEGAPLDERLAEGGMTLEEGVGVLAVVLKALEYVHGQGVVHRDLKPSNIFCARVAGRETIKVLDFGIARISDSTTITRGPVGTWRYAAPEQLAGEEVGPNADVYSAGVILGEMLLGRPLKKGDLTGDLTAGLPAPIVEVFRRAVAEDRAERYSDAREMGLALTGALGGLSREERAAPLPRFTSSLGDSSPDGEGPGWSARPSEPPSPSPVALTPVASPAAASSPPRAPRKGALLTMSVILAFALVGGCIAWYFRHTPPREHGEETTAARDASAIASKLPATDGGASTSAAPGDGSAAARRGDAETDVVVTFLSTPKGAVVSRLVEDGETHELCVTNCQHRFDAGLDAVTVVFRAEGHEDLTKTVALGADRLVEVELTPSRRGKGRAKRTHSPRGGQAAAPARAASPEGGTGFLTVRAIPPSMVFLDGRALGRSPIAKRSVAAGRHVVKLVPTSGGYEAKTVTVTVTAGQNKQVVEYW